MAGTWPRARWGFSPYPVRRAGPVAAWPRARCRPGGGQPMWTVNAATFAPAWPRARPALVDVGSVWCTSGTPLPEDPRTVRLVELKHQMRAELLEEALRARSPHPFPGLVLTVARVMAVLDVRRPSAAVGG